jgi:hypothetical protein
VAGHRVGIHTLEIDLHSSEKLRRLVEVNLGDAALLERELAAMLTDAGRQQSRLNCAVWGP